MQVWINTKFVENNYFRTTSSVCWFGHSPIEVTCYCFRNLSSFSSLNSSWFYRTEKHWHLIERKSIQNFLFILIYSLIVWCWVLPSFLIWESTTCNCKTFTVLLTGAGVEIKLIEHQTVLWLMSLQSCLLQRLSSLVFCDILTFPTPRSWSPCPAYPCFDRWSTCSKACTTICGEGKLKKLTRNSLTFFLTFLCMLARLVTFPII